jgi:hypothetical protein
MVKNGFWNEDKTWALPGWAGPGYSFDHVNLIDTHMVLLFLLKTVWDRGDTLL